MCQKRQDCRGPEIAAILGKDGCSSTLSEPGTVVVYQRQGCSFEPVREMAFALDKDKGLKELRAKMAELIEFLNGCKIFVARSASGALYFELEKAGFSIWEITGKPADFLAIVLEDEEKERVAAQVTGVAGIPAPAERAPGSFFISIKEVQGKSPAISSKQVLQQFIREGQFRELEIICDHVPPWIEMDAACRGFSLSSEKLGPNEVRLRLMKTSAGSCGC
ncbi:MAG: nitrogenase [Methanomicrobiales archaeon HGW-Methanomicrobiales-1]|jgi:Fe-only nitrogenase accessory protein AnfO|nr:MAG: nitrogenase [Methanomicrobiales archaeon HGW-Methanomicrobiales-1]